MRHIIYIIVIATIFVACSEKAPIPKPPLYLRTDFPEHTYKQFNDDCPYTFEISTIYDVKKVENNGAPTCHKDIDLGPLNGVINFSYIEMQKDLSQKIAPTDKNKITAMLAQYVNYSNDKVNEHKLKATGITSENIIIPEKKIFGTIFKLQGDVATPFQFYLTDSTHNFASGIVYFNSRPNYDSIRPSLDYLEQDLMHLINTFEWKK